MPFWTMISSRSWRRHKSVKLLNACVRRNGKRTSMSSRREIKDLTFMFWKVSKEGLGFSENLGK